MANPFFSFKKFTVFHDKCAMKVGIDGVLLGAWASIDGSDLILDIGTGTGLIALMLAQRSEAEIYAIDIDKDAIIQANENVNKSSWPERITVVEKSVQDYAAHSILKFDLIVSNPPYFVNSLKTPIENRTVARHTDTLSHEDLINNAKLLLNKTGRICLILPVNEGLKCVEYAEQKDLFCTKIVWVYPKPDVISKRILLEFSQIYSPKVETELIIESNQRHQYSEDFSVLAKDFYLKL